MSATTLAGSVFRVFFSSPSRRMRFGSWLIAPLWLAPSLARSPSLSFSIPPSLLALALTLTLTLTLLTIKKGRRVVWLRAAGKLTTRERTTTNPEIVGLSPDPSAHDVIDWQPARGNQWCVCSVCDGGKCVRRGKGVARWRWENERENSTTRPTTTPFLSCFRSPSVHRLSTVVGQRSTRSRGLQCRLAALPLLQRTRSSRSVKQRQ